MLVALALNGVPIDVLAERLGTTRGALYKTLHDARRKLRARLAECGSPPTGWRREADGPTGPHAARSALLGPGRPEIGCEECFEELDRYVDLELAGPGCRVGRPRDAAHLAGCPACREDHESLRALAAES